MGKKNTYHPKKQASKFILELQKKQLASKLLQSSEINKEEVIRIYKDYQLFMNWKDAPSIEIEIFNNDPDKLAWVEPPAEENTHFILHIFEGLKARCQKDYESVLFHEFTHVFDHVNLFPIFEKIGAQNVFAWYSEANAVVIAMMNLLDFQNIKQEKLIDLSETIGYRNEEKTLREYFDLMFDEIKLNLTSKDFINTGKHLQYYFGCLKFFVKYCPKSTENFKSLCNTEFMVMNFGRSIMDILSCIFTDDLTPQSLHQMIGHNDNFIQIMWDKQKRGPEIMKDSYAAN